MKEREEKEIEKYKCISCGHLFTEIQMANEFFCYDCEEQLQKCPCCGKKEVYQHNNISKCLNCKEIFNPLIFNSIEKPEILNNDLSALCKCGSLQEFEEFKISDNTMYIVMKCTKCEKIVYNEIIFKNNG